MGSTTSRGLPGKGPDGTARRLGERLRVLDPVVVDALVALFCAALAMVDAALKYRTGAVPGLTASVTVAALCSVSLLARRRCGEIPVLAGLLASVSTNETTLLIFGSWALTRYGHRPWPTSLTVTATAYLATRPLAGASPLSGTTLYHLAVAVVLPGITGAVLNRYDRLHARASRQVTHLQASIDQAIENAVLEERARIAYQMHDGLGHRIAVVALHADAIRLNADRPDKVRHSAEVVHDTARAVMTDLHHILDLLRRPPDELTRLPPGPGPGTVEDHHGLPFLDTLVANLRSVGVRITHRVDGVPRPLPEALRQALLRIARESLTNAVKHAPGAAVELLATYRDDRVELTVTNDRPPGGLAPTLPGSGMGLTGLTALVEQLGGSLHHGPDRGGHRVSAVLPHSPTP